MKYTQTTVKHFTLAMKVEVSRLIKVHDKVGDDWPPWFDPNDIGIFELMVKWLESLETEEPREEYIGSKPYWFMIEVVGRYVNENIENLDGNEIEEIINFVDEYHRKRRADKDNDRRDSVD